MASLTRLLGVDADSSATAIVATTVVTTVALMTLARYTLYPTKPQIIRGPLTTTLPRLSKAELAAVPYKPDHFPGARDVVTPYGDIRVYEFGPEDGRKVLLIHGISTSCMTLTQVAEGLVSKGCRVLLYDIFGRGFSDAPGDLPYDSRLFTSQILMVLASSPLAWTGNNGMCIVGYSLGGGIAVNFATTFPDMIESLVLLAPAGLIRPENFGKASRMIFASGLVPEAVLAVLTKRRLRTPLAGAVAKKPKATTKKHKRALPHHDRKEGVVQAAVSDAVDRHAKNDDDTLQSVNPLEAKIAGYVRWMLDGHEGFVSAFMSTIRFAPLLDQHEHWRLLAKRKPGTTAIILGRQDELIQKDDYEEDALPLVGGKDNVYWRVVEGGHNFPFTNYQGALKEIYEFWGI